MRPGLRSTCAIVALVLAATACTGGRKKNDSPPVQTNVATSADSPDLVVPTGQPVSQVALDDRFIGYIHGRHGAAQANDISFRSRVNGYPVVLEHTGGYKNGGVYNLGVSGGWAVWTETSEARIDNNGDVQWSIVVANLLTKQTRVVASNNPVDVADYQLAPKPVIGDGIAAFAIRGHDSIETTPGSKPDTLEYVRLDATVGQLHTLIPPLQYDPLTIGTAATGINLAILEEGQEGVDQLGFDGQVRHLYRGDLAVSDFGSNRFGATDRPQESSDGTSAPPENLKFCVLPCSKPTTIVQGGGVSEQLLGRDIVTFSGERNLSDGSGRSGDITVISYKGEPIDNLKVGGLAYGGWGISDDTVAWTVPSALAADKRSELIRVRTYTLK